MFKFLIANARWLAAGIVLTLVSSFGQTFFISIFAADIRDAFSLSHAAWGSLYAAGTSASAVAMVWAGILPDRYRTRILALLVCFGLAVACVAMSVSTAIWVLPLIIFGLRFTGQGMSNHLASVAMARWFAANRGKALGFSQIGLAFGEAVLPAICVALLAVLSWRDIWLAAAVVASLCGCVIWTLLKSERTPQTLLEKQPNSGLGGRHWTRRETISHPLFWLVMPTFLGVAAFVTALFFQQVHLAQIKGWTHLDVAAMFPAYTLASVAALMGSGWAIDRWGVTRVIPLYLLPIALAFIGFWAADHKSIGHLSFALMGMTSGAGGPVFGSFWSEIYGTRHLGAIRSLASAGVVFGSAIGPILTGALIDAQVDFGLQCLGIALWFVVANLILCFALMKFSRKAAVDESIAS